MIRGKVCMNVCQSSFTLLWELRRVSLTKTFSMNSRTNRNTNLTFYKFSWQHIWNHTLRYLPRLDFWNIKILCIFNFFLLQAPYFLPIWSPSWSTVFPWQRRKLLPSQQFLYHAKNKREQITFLSGHRHLIWVKFAQLFLYNLVESLTSAPSSSESVKICRKNSLKFLSKFPAGFLTDPLGSPLVLVVSRSKFPIITIWLPKSIQKNSAQVNSIFWVDFCSVIEDYFDTSV